MGSAHQGLTRVVSWGCPSRFGPRPSGLNPGGGFPFFLVSLSCFLFVGVMAQRVTRRTVGLDVSGLAASNDRKEVSQFIVEHFAHCNIHAVQFVGTIAKVTFAVEASKQQVICHQSISINGVQCAVRGGGPRAQNVLIYNYPVEGNEEPIRRKLAAYGTVESVAFRHWPHLPNISDGVRVVRMVRREAIPRHLTIGDFPVKISYAGQQQVCDLCAAPGHIAWVCPLKGKCFQCGLEGHLSRDCPQRAGYRARGDAVEDVPDPTPAEARASGAPQTESDVDVRDNQLDELSQSILAPIRASIPPVGSSLLGDDASDSIDGINSGNDQATHVDNVAVVNNVVANNKVNENSVNNGVVEHNVVSNNGSNVVNNNLVVNESIVVNSNLVENESTVNNNVVGNNNAGISTKESSVANQNSIEEPNYSPVSDSVNIVDPGSSSLCASSLDSGDENLVEPSSSGLISSGVADMVMEGASDSRKRALVEVSSDGESVDSSPATVVKTKLPVRKQKGVRKIPTPSPSAATPRALRSSSLVPGLSRGLKLAAAEWARLSKRS